MDKWNEFKRKTIQFFTIEENQNGEIVRKANKQNVTAVLIAGFVGWILLTATLGARIKRTLKKVPIIGMVFKGKTTKRRAPKRRMTRRRRR